MPTYQGPIFDADNHYYEAHDAFTRHVPRRMQSRCVEWVELEGGRKYQVVGGRIDRSGNPTFNPISKPGVLREYFSGNPRGVTSFELIRSSLEPMPPEYMDRDARIARMDEQGLDGGLALPHPGRPLRGAAEERRGCACAPPSAPSTSGSSRGLGAQLQGPHLHLALHFAGRRRLGVRAARMGARARCPHPGDAPQRRLHAKRCRATPATRTSTPSGPG